MSTISVDDFTPTQINSGDSIQVKLTYSTPHDGFIVVNEGHHFDATPGRIPVASGQDRSVQAELRVARQPQALSDNCLITFTLGPASYTILVFVS